MHVKSMQEPSGWKYIALIYLFEAEVQRSRVFSDCQKDPHANSPALRNLLLVAPASLIPYPSLIPNGLGTRLPSFAGLPPAPVFVCLQKHTPSVFENIFAYCKQSKTEAGEGSGTRPAPVSLHDFILSQSVSFQDQDGNSFVFVVYLSPQVLADIDLCLLFTCHLMIRC